MLTLNVSNQGSGDAHHLKATIQVDSPLSSIVSETTLETLSAGTTANMGPLVLQAGDCQESKVVSVQTFWKTNLETRHPLPSPSLSTVRPPIPPPTLILPLILPPILPLTHPRLTTVTLLTNSNVVALKRQDGPDWGSWCYRGSVVAISAQRLERSKKIP